MSLIGQAIEYQLAFRRRASAFADHSLTLHIYFNKFFLFCQNIFYDFIPYRYSHNTLRQSFGAQWEQGHIYSNKIFLFCQNIFFITSFYRDSLVPLFGIIYSVIPHQSEQQDSNLRNCPVPKTGRVTKLPNTPIKLLNFIPFFIRIIFNIFFP